MVQQPAFWPKDTAQHREVLLDLPMADVLGHPDGRDRIERLAGELPVVLQPDLDAIRDTRLGHSEPGELCLLLADGHTDDASAVVRGRVDRHGPPPAADIEQTRAGVLVQSELAAHQLVLRRLRLLQCRSRLDESGAGVSHARSEHDPVELVADVVVVTDRLRVTTERVPEPSAPTAEAGFLRRWRQAAVEDAEPAGGRGHGRNDPPGPLAVQRVMVAQRLDGTEHIALQLEVA